MTVVYAWTAEIVRKMMFNLNPDYLDVMLTLKYVRIVAGYTLEDVERISNGEFTKEAVGSYERNDRNITVKRLLKLCDVYGVSIDAVIRHSMYGDRIHVMRRRKHGLRTTA
jgi:transcriptional regulator with XRE-family HTH domain